jgi:hypothetical protein
MKIMIRNLGVVYALFLMMVSVTGYSQACIGNQVTVTMENVQQTANTVEFDVYIKNTGTTLLLQGMQGAMIHNVGFIPTGSTTTFTAVTQPVATGNFVVGYNNVGPAYTAASRQFRWSHTPVGVASGLGVFCHQHADQVRAFQDHKFVEFHRELRRYPNLPV